MAEEHDHLTFDQQQHLESHAAYGTVFWILLNFTAMEYIYAKFHTSFWLAMWMLLAAFGITILTAIAAAVFKFQFNRNWVLLPIVPAILLSFIPLPLILGLMVLAVTKATLVGMYFMHLKFEGNWVYFMLVPAAFLACVFIFGLTPDIAMQPGPPPGNPAQEEPEEVSAIAPDVERVPLTFLAAGGQARP